MKKKTILSIVLAASLVLTTLVGCGDSGNSSGNNSSNNTSNAGDTGNSTGNDSGATTGGTLRLQVCLTVFRQQ